MTRAGRLARLGLLAAASAGAGCSGGGGSGPKPFDDMSAEEHLACAVEISAYTYNTFGQRHSYLCHATAQPVTADLQQRVPL